MKNILTILAVLLIAATTQAQEFTCPLMGWTASAPTGWELKERKNLYNPMQNMEYFRSTGMSMGSAKDAPPTSPPPPPAAIPADPKDYQGVTIKRTNYNYIVIETHRISRKDVKNVADYSITRENVLKDEAKGFEQYRDLNLTIEPISDTERIDDKKFYTLQLNIQQNGQPKLRTYTFRWYNDKYELHATIVADNMQYLQEMRMILTATANSITTKK